MTELFPIRGARVKKIKMNHLFDLITYSSRLSWAKINQLSGREKSSIDTAMLHNGSFFVCKMNDKGMLSIRSLCLKHFSNKIHWWMAIARLFLSSLLYNKHCRDWFNNYMKSFQHTNSNFLSPKYLWKWFRAISFLFFFF